MGPSHMIATIYGVVLTITAANGHHFLRGCQDIDPKCALLDEMRANGGRVKLEAQQIQEILHSIFPQILLWHKKCVMLGQTTIALSHAIDVRTVNMS